MCSQQLTCFSYKHVVVVVVCLTCVCYIGLYNFNVSHLPSFKGTIIKNELENNNTGKRLDVIETLNNKASSLIYAGQSTKRGRYQHAIKLPNLGKNSISLVIRTTSSRVLLQFLYCSAFRTIALYWSKRLGNVTLILNEDTKQDHVLAKSLLQHQKTMGIQFNFRFEPLPKTSNLLEHKKSRSSGYNRQLYSSFIMDYYIQTPIIAWTDTDSIFMVPIVPENILNGDKLRSLGMKVYPHGWITAWDEQTRKMIGKRMPVDFMSYFPVYIWRDTITNCRKYILKYMKVNDIESALYNIDTGHVSPVNVIMTYAYYFENDRYDWHFDLREDNVSSYNQKHLEKGYGLPPNHLTPSIQTTLHEKYYKTKVKVNAKAYCLAIKGTSLKVSKIIKTMCLPYQNGTMWELFHFCKSGIPSYLSTWCLKDKELCLKIILNQYKLAKEYINLKFYDLDLKKVMAVEKAAKQMNITCPAYFKYNGVFNKRLV